MQRIARSIDHRQSQDGARKLSVIHDYALNWNFVVFVVHPREHGFQLLSMFGTHRRIAAHIGIFGDWNFLQWTGVAPEKNSVGAINVLATDGYDPAGNA